MFIGEANAWEPVGVERSWRAEWQGKDIHDFEAHTHAGMHPVVRRKESKPSGRDATRNPPARSISRKSDRRLQGLSQKPDVFGARHARLARMQFQAQPRQLCRGKPQPRLGLFA